jgi:hypothetical protein
MTRGSVFAILLSFAFCAPAGAVGRDFNPYGNEGGNVVSGDNGGSTMLVPDANSAVYIWQSGTTWRLQTSFYDGSNQSRAPVSGDYVVPIQGASTSECTPLPTITVTAPPYSGSVGLYMVNTINLQPPAQGGGFRSIFRAPRPYKGTKDGDEDLTCASSENERMLSARDVIATSTSPYSRAGIYTINYGPGSSQQWLVTQPLLTTLGLVPAGSCVGP